MSTRLDSGQEIPVKGRSGLSSSSMSGPHFFLFIVLIFMGINSSGLCARNTAPREEKNAWVFTLRSRDIGIIILHLSSGSTKFESQLVSALGSSKSDEIRIYSDETKKYCVMSKEKSAAVIKTYSKLDELGDEKLGYHFTPWKRVGTETKFGLRVVIYEQIKTAPKRPRILKRCWIVDDRRFLPFTKDAYALASITTRNSFPVVGILLKTSREFVSDKPVTKLKQTTPTQAQTERPMVGSPNSDLAQLALLGDLSRPPEQLRNPAPLPQTAPRLRPIVLFDTVSVKQEKVKPEIFVLPKGYKRVESLAEVIDFGGIDGRLAL